jgi:hypothetical protein
LSNTAEDETITADTEGIPQHVLDAFIRNGPSIGRYTVHPACAMFPPLTPAAYAELYRSIATIGQRESVRLWRDQVLDGVHRLSVCAALGREPRIEVLLDDANPWQLAVAYNLTRRHLTTQQRALIAAEIAQAGEGRPKKLPPGREFSPTAAQAAAVVDVSVASVERAKAVLQTEDLTLIAAVKQGKIGLKQGEVLAQIEPQIRAGLLEEKLMDDAATTPPQAKPVAPWEAEALDQIAEATKAALHSTTPYVSRSLEVPASAMRHFAQLLATLRDHNKLMRAMKKGAANGS